MRFETTRGFRQAVFAVAVGLSLAGCSSNPLQLATDPEPLAAAAEVQAATGATFRLRPGQTASVGGQLLVAFRGVKSDSRCPTGVQCVWAGDAEAVIGLALERGSWTWTSLHTGIEPRSTAGHGYTVRLVGVEPATTANVSISPDRYVAVLEVARQ